MAQAEPSKAPIVLVAIAENGEEFVAPPISAAQAGGNSVRIINMLDKPITVEHNGRLVAPSDPFTVPPLGQGGPPQAYPIASQYDVSGTKITLHMEASVLRALGLTGDPVIIIW